MTRREKEVDKKQEKYPPYPGKNIYIYTHTHKWKGQQKIEERIKIKQFYNPFACDHKETP